MPRRCRRTFTRDTRRILANCSEVSGWASGSDSAAATTASSVIASSRAQSVLPRGRVSPGFTSTRVVPVLLMSCGLSGRYDSAAILVAQGDDHEQDVDLSHSDDLNSLLAVHELRVELFQSVQVFEGRNGIHEIHAVLAKVFGGFAIVPFVLHKHLCTGYR